MRNMYPEISRLDLSTPKSFKPLDLGSRYSSVGASTNIANTSMDLYKTQADNLVSDLKPKKD